MIAVSASDSFSKNHTAARLRSVTNKAIWFQTVSHLFIKKGEELDQDSTVLGLLPGKKEDYEQV